MPLSFARVPPRLSRGDPHGEKHEDADECGHVEHLGETPAHEPPPRTSTSAHTRFPHGIGSTPHAAEHPATATSPRPDSSPTPAWTSRDMLRERSTTATRTRRGPTWDTLTCTASSRACRTAFVTNSLMTRHTSAFPASSDQSRSEVVTSLRALATEASVRGRVTL
ncbi:hypothetical protein GCM10010400_23990 [Streptomyces aculeolatus]